MTNTQQLAAMCYVVLFAFFFMNAFIAMSKCHYYVQKGDAESKPFKKVFFSATGWLILALMNFVIAFYSFASYIN